MRHVVTHCILYKRSREQEREGERERGRDHVEILLTLVKQQSLFYRKYTMALGVSFEMEEKYY